MANWTEADIANWRRAADGRLLGWLKDGKTLDQVAEEPVVKIPKIRQWNKTEQAFGQYLDLQRVPHGFVKQWYYEALTLKLGPDCRYTPDFLVIDAAGQSLFYEVKGRNRSTGKAYAKDDAMAKLRMAAGMFPWPFVLVWPDGRGGWETKAI